MPWNSKVTLEQELCRRHDALLARIRRSARLGRVCDGDRTQPGSAPASPRSPRRPARSWAARGGSDTRAPQRSRSRAPGDKSPLAAATPRAYVVPKQPTGEVRDDARWRALLRPDSSSTAASSSIWRVKEIEVRPAGSLRQRSCAPERCRPCTSPCIAADPDGRRPRSARSHSRGDQTSRRRRAPTSGVGGRGAAGVGGDLRRGVRCLDSAAGTDAFVTLDVGLARSVGSSPRRRSRTRRRPKSLRRQVSARSARPVGRPAASAAELHRHSSAGASLRRPAPRHPFAQPTAQDLEALAEVDERVADDDRALALDPEQEPRSLGWEAWTPAGEPIAGRVRVCVALLRGAATTGRADLRPSAVMPYFCIRSSRSRATA